MKDIKILDMTIDDYDEVIRLWNNTEGIGLSNSDTKKNIDYYLRRNPGLSLVAKIDGMVIGAILCGHDGRRGYIHHLAVYTKYRGFGIGSSLVDCSLNKLRLLGIDKCHIFVFEINTEGMRFWERTGWIKRYDLSLMSRYTNR